jgi:hypothetical protein
MRKFVIVAALLLTAAPFIAQARDMDDRALGLELNRDRSESRIERLHEDKQREDKARAEVDKSQRVPAKKPAKPAPRPPQPN